MIYRSRKIVKYEDLNPRGTLFGGTLLSWIDEEAAIYAICQIGDRMVVTKAISKIDFKSSPKLGDIIEIGMDLVRVGNTSITLKCNVRNKDTKEDVITIDEIVFVRVDETGKPKAIQNSVQYTTHQILI
jgi:acyl-CoA thioesterase YciA